MVMTLMMINAGITCVKDIEEDGGGGGVIINVTNGIVMANAWQWRNQDAFQKSQGAGEGGIRSNAL